MLFATVFAYIALVVFVKGDSRHDRGEGDDMRFTEKQLRMMKSRSVSTYFDPWPYGKVPYILGSSFSSSSYHTSALDKSINLFTMKTCIRIVPRKNETNYVKFVNTGPSGYCDSKMGMVTGEQIINIADWCTGKPYSDGTRSSWYSMVHEIMHALGFTHEQMRPDRDDYVWVNMSHPEAKGNFNYEKTPTSQSMIVSKYDFDSVMHYGGQIGLLETNDPQYQSVIGQRDHVSDCDIAKINRYYECSSIYQQSACPVSVPDYEPDYYE